MSKQISDQPTLCYNVRSLALRGIKGCVCDVICVVHSLCLTGECAKKKMTENRTLRATFLKLTIDFINKK